MTAYTLSQLQSIWTQAAAGTSYDTPAWSSLMAAIALSESSGDPTATNPNDNGGTQTSYGLWQISNGTHNAPTSNWATPAANAQLALQKLQAQGLGAWGTYVSGAYQANLPTGTALPTNATITAAGATAAGATAGAATTAGATPNPVDWALNPVTGLEWAGNWLTGGQVGNITSEVTGLGGITQGLVGITQTISKVGQLFLILFQPARWLRIGAFFVGVFALVAGLRFMGESL